MLDVPIDRKPADPLPDMNNQSLHIWVERLTWPAVAYLGSQVAYWIWFDAIFKQVWLALTVCTVFVVVALLATLYTVKSWFPGVLEPTMRVPAFRTGHSR